MNLVSPIINKYKKQRKYRHLSSQYSKKYAFVGVGNHSMNNLYPVLDYLHIPIKYIVTKSEETAQVINNSNNWAYAIADINIALNDPEIAGIFISANPDSHYSLLKKCIENKKHVFVEKPPCSTLNQLNKLIEIQQNNPQTVLVGLQKRYAPAYNILKSKLKHPQHYILRYCLGAYPEGDKLMDLFIHPIDMVCYLFGDADISSLVNVNTSTMLVHLKHKNGVCGSLELSTAYSWQMPIEQLTVVTKSGVFELNTTAELLFKKKPAIINNIPVEKILKFTPETKILFNQNSFLPVLEHNNIYVNGFYTEIERFASICEGKNNENLSNLPSLLPTYKILKGLME